MAFPHRKSRGGSPGFRRTCGAKKAINTEIVSRPMKAEQIARAGCQTPSGEKIAISPCGWTICAPPAGLDFRSCSWASASFFWMTIVGANVPGENSVRRPVLDRRPVEPPVSVGGSTRRLHGFLVEGVYRGMAWSFPSCCPPWDLLPIFTLLEDAGYLPRVAFNMDRLFKAAGATENKR